MRRPIRLANMPARGWSMARGEGQFQTEAFPGSPVGAVPDGDEERLFCETEFLGQLGDRVREMRALHRMSRRELARRSGISERYIAQIEAGKGNVSIVKLLRIAIVFRYA